MALTIDLTGRTALVTGSNRGIGRAVAEALAAAGANVMINHPTDADAEEADTVVAAIRRAGGSAQSCRADVTEPDEVEQLVAKTEALLGPVDILVNNAGVAHSAPVEDMPVDDWDRVLAVHLRGTFLTCRRVLPTMYERDYGRIVNTASQLAYKGAPGFSHYTAAKGAILSFTRSLALEIGARNVNANCIAPGATMTRMLEDVPGEVLEAIRASIPKGRIAEVSDIAPWYVFLASDAARHLQGQCVSPNGGDVFL